MQNFGCNRTCKSGSKSQADVLLLGGTSEGWDIASELARKRIRVLASQATSVCHSPCLDSYIRLRHGPLDVEDLYEVLVREGIKVVVDASHPYAQKVSRFARRAALRADAAYLRYERPGILQKFPETLWADSHELAADYLCGQQGNVLLSVGVLYAGTYSRKIATDRLYVRCMSAGASFLRLLQSDVRPANIFFAANKKPNFVDNLLHLRMSGATWLVTKDSGEAGGVPDKAEAARRCAVKVLGIKRPAPCGGEQYSDPQKLLARVTKLIG